MARFWRGWPLVARTGTETFVLLTGTIFPLGGFLIPLSIISRAPCGKSGMSKSELNISDSINDALQVGLVRFVAVKFMDPKALVSNLLYCF